MAEGTRVSQLTKSLAKFREEYQEFREEYKEFKASTTVSQTSTAAFQTSTQTTLEEILKRIPALDSTPVQTNKNKDPVQPNKDTELVVGETSGSKNTMDVESTAVPEGGGIQAKAVQLEFPKFDGADPIDWVPKAQQFFSYGQIPDNQKVPISAFHMEGRAL